MQHPAVGSSQQRTSREDSTKKGIYFDVPHRNTLPGPWDVWLRDFPSQMCLCSWEPLMDSFFLHGCFVNPCKFSASTKSRVRDFTAVPQLQKGSHPCLCPRRTTCRFQVCFHFCFWSFCLRETLLSNILSDEDRSQLWGGLFKRASSGVPLTTAPFYSTLIDCKVPFFFQQTTTKQSQCYI